MRILITGYVMYLLSSVGTSALNNSPPTEHISVKFYNGVFFLPNLSTKFKFGRNLTKMTFFCEDFPTFLTMRRHLHAKQKKYDISSFTT